ncbi:MAG: dienelactone hydrolase family protein [Paracoccaceae bacterium]|nr:dienelactone hydrolase family protein [Paracoccaceae bacterium]
MSKRDLVIKTADGAAKAGLFLPEGAHKGMPGVILFMDAFGPRPALDGMAERLAAAGYAVLVPDLFYRFGNYGPFDIATAFTTDSTRAQIMSMLQATTQELTTRDNEAFIAALTEAGADKIGAVGYCMGGARALTLAAKYPGRVVAAASFHGGNLASDAPDSPHLGAASIKARLYIGCAGVDRSFPPEQAARLVQALREAEVDHTLENYTGMAHGWCVPDHSVYDAKGAERHWCHLLAFFGEAFA